MSAACPECGGPPTHRGGTGETLIGYGPSACGKPHDDNCLFIRLYCAKGHAYSITLRRSCDCGWLGKLTCFCHAGEKVLAPEVLDLPHRAAIRGTP